MKILFVDTIVIRQFWKKIMQTKKLKAINRSSKNVNEYRNQFKFWPSESKGINEIGMNGWMKFSGLILEKKYAKKYSYWLLWGVHSEAKQEVWSLLSNSCLYFKILMLFPSFQLYNSKNPLRFFS